MKIAAMGPPSAEDVRRLAIRSKRYRNELAAAASMPGTSMIVYEPGHGVTLAAAMAGRKAGANTMLLVVPKHTIPVWLEQLGKEHFAVTAVGGKKGTMSEACRKAAVRREAQETEFLVFLASPDGMAEAGHWHAAWRGRKPFGFVAVLDAQEFRNIRSEKNAGMKTVADRSGNAVLFVERNTAPERIRGLSEAWNLRPVPVLPNTEYTAACPCRAMDPDQD